MGGVFEDYGSAERWGVIMFTLLGFSCRCFSERMGVAHQQNKYAQLRVVGIFPSLTA